MLDYELRAVTEKRELDDKLLKLVSFIAQSPLFQSLTPEMRVLMRQQREAMIVYSDLLEKRIRLFSEP